MNVDFRQDILPHLVAVIAFLVVTVVFFNPVFFESKKLNQHDIKQWEGSAKELLDHREQTGEEGLWTNSMFGGMPGYLINVEWSDGPILLAHRVFTLGLPHPIRLVFASFLSFYILLLSFRNSPYASIGFSIAFGLSSYMIIGLVAGHSARIGAIAYMPLVLAGVHTTISGRRWLGLGLSCIAMALHFRINHLQITYYLLLVIVMYGLIMLYSMWKQKRVWEYVTNVGLLVAVALIAVGSLFGRLWSTYEYGQYSMRGPSEITIGGEQANTAGLKKDYAFQYSNGIFEPLTLVIPNFMGGGSSEVLYTDPGSKTREALQRSGDQQTASQLARFATAYWGKQPATAPYYAGATIGFLFLIGLMVTERRNRVWLLAMLAAGIVLSWGSNFSTLNYFVFDYLPGYNKFRSVTFTIIMAIIALGIGAALGVRALLEDNPRLTLRKLLIALGVTGGTCLLLIVFGGAINMSGPFDSQLPSWFTLAVKADRVAILRMDALRSLVFIGLAFGACYVYMKGMLGKPWVTIILTLLIVVDVWSVATRYISNENFERNPTRAYFAETEADRMILRDPDLSYRVYALPVSNETRTSYHHKSLWGYHGAKIRRYQDLFDHVIEGQTQQLIDKLRSGQTSYEDLGAINMLNARYFLAGSSVAGVFRNTSALGNAWFVKSLQPVANPDEEIQALNTLKTSETAVIDQSKFAVSNTSFNAQGTIRLTSYAPNSLTYEYESPAEAFAVFSEIYYPDGWVAFVDNQETPIHRVNYVLRGMKLPAGSHSIEFRFEPTVYRIGNPVTATFSYLVVLLFLGSLYMTIMRGNGQG